MIGEYVVFRVAIACFACVPRRAALRLGAWLGELAYVLAFRLRRIGLFNLGLAFPEKDEGERRAILRRSCRNLGRVAAEWCRLPALDAAAVQRLVTIADPDRWRAALAEAAERGGIVITAHLGNFELLAYAHGLFGHPVTLVHNPIRNPLINEAIVRRRAQAGTISLAKKSAAKAALHALREHRIIAIPADQNQTRRYGVFVDLFGVPACTTPGPARLAMLSGAPIVPVFLIREDETEHHRMELLPAIAVADSGDRAADILTTTQRCNAAIEAMVRRYPDQWVWFHKRWNTRPLGAPRIYPR